MLQRLFHGHVLTIIVLYVMLAAFLSFFDPYKLPALLLLLPFILFFGATFLLTYRCVVWLTKKVRLQIAPPKIARIIFLVVGAPTFLLLLQSIGQVGLYDIVITAILFAATDLFLARSRFSLFKTVR